MSKSNNKNNPKKSYPVITSYVSTSFLAICVKGCAAFAQLLNSMFVWACKAVVVTIFSKT